MQIAPTTSAPNTPPVLPGMAPGHADDGAFSALLADRSQAAQPPARPSGAAPNGRTEADHAAARRAEAQRLEKRKAEAPADRRSDESASAAANEDVKDTETTQAADESAATQAADAERPALDPALLEWLAAMNRPVAADAAAAGAGDDALSTAADSRGATRLLWREAPGLAGAGMAATAEALDAKAQDRTAAQAVDLLALAGDAAGTAAAASDAPLAALQLDAAASAPAEAPRTVDALAALTAAATPTTAERSAAPLGVTLRTPATAPEFREALAAQVSVLARDGVQEARLHLNPADMGPISVQIALHGTQAQVNFGADSAATRDLIQAGLPELAAALSEAGLTLAGGGVSQHARGGSNEGGTGTRGTGGHAVSGVDNDPGDPVAAAQQARSSLRAALGGVDLFA